ncbi:GMC oxidoreductase [Laetiporus sulphureus 93-53]|uniref:GMC oxidoreductase n=1 Tax=Laetiporus sulphureus 93-53 TaxID=1314785 RepID=A0A165BEL7_9APHY|nr:GMC oxidoreductase [Laetiporus sulphureus 93-53]KZT00887.1 GMC oxidoreductase [Laetiporus sulphureus 93-53]
MKSRVLLTLAAVGWPMVNGGKLYTDPTDVTDSAYDFIIVGGGTAGNVLAHRLSEDPSHSVLVIEAGVSNLENIKDQVPFLSGELSPNTSIAWNQTTTPQSGLLNRTVNYPHGFVLGGSSSINHMVWTRGSVDDYDRYARVSKDDGWSWNNMFPYMEKSEALVPPNTRRKTGGQVNPAVHGWHGPVEISLPASSSIFDEPVLSSGFELSHLFPYNIDMNSGYPMGLGWAVGSVSADRKRTSSATSYLWPAMNRSNLDVLIDTRVTRLLAAGITDGMLSFTKVETAQSASSNRVVFEARKEVILSAGSINTPQILLLSGIGDADYLRSLNIQPLVDLKDVGRNLMDQTSLVNAWYVNSNITTWDEAYRNETLANELFEQWETTGTGLYGEDAATQIAWSRLSSKLISSHDLKDPSAGIASPHLEFIFNNGYFPSITFAEDQTGNYFSIVTNVVSPASRGSITLASNDPFAYPLVDAGLLVEPFDIFALVHGIKLAKKFLEAPAFAGYIKSAARGLADANTDEELEEYARSNADSGFHPVGSAVMAPYNSNDGVVRPDLRVKRVSGLRVVDASVLPYVPAAHMQACIYAVAERAADIIKEYWKDDQSDWLGYEFQEPLVAV